MSKCILVLSNQAPTSIKSDPYQKEMDALEDKKF